MTKFFHLSIVYLFLLLIVLAASCQKQPDYLEEALQFAGTNRPELEKVPAHYSVNPADSLKYRAAVFLIEKKTGYGIKPVYENLPSGTVYWIRNLSRGRDERIFSYENENLQWW